MPAPTSASDRVLAKKFGAWLKETRTHLGLTQLDVATRLNYGYFTMVSQVERGVTSIPPTDLPAWAEVLRIPTQDFARKFTYYSEPFIHAALFGENPYVREKLPIPDKAITPARARADARNAAAHEAGKNV